MNQPPVSIVVPVYNCEKTIALTLNGIADQTYKEFEIIVVDDGSNDSTAEIVKSFKEVTYVYQKNAGPAAARNRGAQTASHKIIFFIDSDCIPQKNWIEQAVGHFQDAAVGVVSGSYGIANEQSVLARMVHQEILFRHQKLMPRYPKSFGSYNFGVRKNVFDEVKGFNTAYRFASGEDNDLSYKIQKAGYRIYFERNALVDHFHPTDLVKYFKEQGRHGFWRAKMYFDHFHMVGGDDYTFWKDIAEVPLSALVILCLIFSTFGLPFAGLAAASMALVLLIIELFFAFKAIKNIFEMIFFGFVMFLRAFIRLFGFSSGIFYFSAKKLVKKPK